MSLYHNKAHESIPTKARQVYDVSGAGDTVIAALSIEMRVYLDDQDKKKEHKWHLNEKQKLMIVFLTAFIVALVIYYIMHLLIGFGGGMLSN